MPLQMLNVLCQWNITFSFVLQLQDWNSGTVTFFFVSVCVISLPLRKWKDFLKQKYSQSWYYQSTRGCQAKMSKERGIS